MSEFELPLTFYPRCAMCDMPVESFGFELLGLESEAVVFVAHCHGDIETVFFSLEDLEGIKEIELGLAFANPTNQTHYVGL